MTSVKSYRSPHKERELKFTRSVDRKTFKKIAPHAGARIEMVIDAELIPAAFSLPIQGARIEIALKEELLEIAATAPHVGSEN